MDKQLANEYSQTLERRIKALESRNRAYQQAINKIDDWFEYMNESVADRKKIHEILDNLTLRLNNDGV